MATFPAVDGFPVPAVTSVTCLLTVGSNGTRRKLMLEQPNLRGLKDAVNKCRLLSVEVDCDNDRFQVLDKDFNEYIDLADEDSVPDLSIIRVLKTTQVLTSEGNTHVIDVLSDDVALSLGDSVRTLAQRSMMTSVNMVSNN
ncbi:uncharacterized protein LOC125756248 [Rhipicephalus sanguineus]|uniref:uncharacterized protein LOC125756248 n=1 Tax=Rhipicephalus sanguineus TaxID=34632 RepID=UPI0020C21582|nr:uncharacterized protein LOC125756248 [Rhipicephalus sanguineus]